MTAVLAMLVAAGVWLSFPAAPGRKIDRPPPPAEAPRPALTRRLRPLLAAVGCAGGWAFVGGASGVPAGLVAAAVVWVVLGRVEDPSAVRRREELSRDLPVAVDLLGGCVRAGAAVEPSLLTVAGALGGPVAEELRVLHHRLGVGTPPDRVWRDLAVHPQLGPLGRALGRAHETGAAVAAAIDQLAGELAATGRAEVEARARSIEVKAAAPLGLCLLPAFLVLGVVPMVVAVFDAMALFG